MHDFELTLFNNDPENWGNLVGQESRKTWNNKYLNKFWFKYCNGFGIDIGGKGYIENVKPILPSAQIVDLDFPNYNGKILPFENNSQDYVYSSHFLEHVEDYKIALQEQFRVLKPGGHIVLVVPHRDLYEKKYELPSRFNGDHKRFYTPASLLKEIEESLEINTYRIRHLQDNDKGHDYSQPLEEHSKGCYEIELVLQKLWK